MNEFHDFDILVGNSFKSEDGFNSVSFSKCAHYNGNFNNQGDNVKIDCTEVNRGRYVAIHMHTDYFVGTGEGIEDINVYMTGLNRGDDTQQALSLCDVEVFGQPG